MRILSFLLLSLLVLSGCTWGDKKETTPTNQYPSIPLGVSTEITLPPNTPSGSAYKATGTEPFWSVDVTPGKAVLSRPGDTDVQTETFVTTEDNKGAIIIVRSVKGDFFLNLTKGSCSDGMSDTKYTHNATVLVGDVTLTGCANKK